MKIWKTKYNLPKYLGAENFTGDMQKKELA